MKNAEIRALSIEDLKEQINKEQSGAQTLRFAHAISPLENPTRIKTGRRNIARLLTELKRREQEQNS